MKIKINVNINSILKSIINQKCCCCNSIIKSVFEKSSKKIAFFCQSSYSCPVDLDLFLLNENSYLIHFRKNNFNILFQNNLFYFTFNSLFYYFDKNITFKDKIQFQPSNYQKNLFLKLIRKQELISLFS